MSNKSYTNSSRNNTSRHGSSYDKSYKKYCKVCHDAGKPESLYTNHFVRSVPGPKGFVTCPTLLSYECRHCYEKGHTVKFCPKIKQETRTKPVFVNQETPVKKAKQVERQETNVFLSLKSDSDSDNDNDNDNDNENTNKSNKKDFPPLKSMSFINAVKAPENLEFKTEQLPFGFEVLSMKPRSVTLKKKTTKKEDTSIIEKGRWCNTGNWGAESSDDDSDNEN